MNALLCTCALQSCSSVSTAHQPTLAQTKTLVQMLISPAIMWLSILDMLLSTPVKSPLQYLNKQQRAPIQVLHFEHT